MGRGAPQSSLGAGTRRMNGSHPQDGTGGALQHPATDKAGGIKGNTEMSGACRVEGFDGEWGQRQTAMGI